ncbi:phosphatidylserine/phosphatidylglycerophosphate/cardiolipin synthase family protein [Mesorhizobium newzealandense]|uniref:Phosphatidylserine/phosphatidylglycerophosphate/ cardiolipin synthase family protein n=1 Tax=Mesorhizobium newzealandense TaxID=1300302 RepID=A0ABW4UI41_9HYPH
MNAAERYGAIARLLEAQPNTGDIHDVLRWMGRAQALVEGVSQRNASGIANAGTFMGSNGTQKTVQNVNMHLYAALAIAEMEAPHSSQGSFVVAGKPFDAMMAVGKVLSAAKSKVRIVDPYMDEKALTEFALLANEGVNIELLGSPMYKTALLPAAQKFIQQYGSNRPLEVRLAGKHELHDRLILVDGSQVYTLSQSLRNFAERSPALISRVDDPDIIVLKIAAYDAFWNGASAI